MATGTKRDYSGRPRQQHSGGDGSKGAAADVVKTEFSAMFEKFRDELDEHHDRRERIIKASRDVTALSKKM